MVAREVHEEKIFKYVTLSEQWKEFIDFIASTDEYMTGFLKTVESVRVEKSILFLMLKNDYNKKLDT